LNRPEKQEKAWYIFYMYVIKPQGGLDHDVCGLGFSKYGNVPTHVIARFCGTGRDYIIYGTTKGSGYLVSYCWLLRYRGGPPEASGMDPFVVQLL